MESDLIKQYWEHRAASDASAQSTTQDYYLREIEFSVLRELVNRLHPSSVADLGCGDARTTTKLALEFPSIMFFGYDYSEAMIENARKVVAEAMAPNVTIGLCDVARTLSVGNPDFIFTTRCLINLPSWQTQQQALDHIHEVLPRDGHYIMIENFMEGHDNFNRMREAYGLPKIGIRSHNLFFERPKLGEYLKEKYEVVEEANISSTYYLVSRVIYSKLCSDKTIEPDYFDDHHRYAARLPFLGEYGPVRMLCLRKK